jgi:hypothetical protein
LALSAFHPPFARPGANRHESIYLCWPVDNHPLKALPEHKVTALITLLCTLALAVAWPQPETRLRADNQERWRPGARLRSRQMLIIVFLVAAIAAVAAVGLITVTVMGVAREEADRSLHAGPSTRASALTRRIVGLHSTIRW